MRLKNLSNGLLRMALFAAAGLAALPAYSGVLSSPVGVSLISPGGFTDGITPNTTPFTLSDSVSTAAGIHPGDGSNVGGFMLSSEFISFAGDNISLRSAAGADTSGVLTTGYLGSGGAHARYEFTGLDVAGEEIIGFNVTSISGLLTFTNPSDFIHLLSANSLSIDLDTLIFASNPLGTSLAGMDLTIDLLTRACTNPNCGGGGDNRAPEPASLALVLVALASTAGLRRRATTGHTR